MESTFHHPSWRMDLRQRLVSNAGKSVEVIIKRFPLCQALKQTRLSFLWKSKISLFDGLTASNDNPLSLLRSALKLENRYYLCNFPALFQKGAFRHALLVLFISMLVFFIVKYQISKFSYRWQAYDRALQRNQHKTQLLSGERGGPS